MFSKPLPENEWLQQMVGEWTYEGGCFMGPGQPEMKTSGTETVRSVGGLWVIAEGQGKTPDGEDATMIFTVGYDADLKKYVGTWIASMMSRLWVYDIQREGNTLHMYAEGPAFDDPSKTATYRDSVELTSENSRKFYAGVKNPDGSWMQFMNTVYTRVK